MDMPVIPMLPEAPQRSTASATYAQMADAWAAAIGPWTVMLNQYGDYLNSTLPGISLAAGSVQGALAAGAVATNAAANSQFYAAAAALSAGVSTTLGGGQPFQCLQLAKDGYSLGFGEPGQAGDVLFSTRNPGPLYLPATGGVRAQSSYPTLFAALGIQGGIPGHLWSSTPGPNAAGGATISAAPSGTVVRGVGVSLYRSADNGKTWSGAVLTVANGFAITAIANDGAGVWIALTNNTAYNGTTYRSTDDGLSWGFVQQNGTISGGRNGLATDGSGTWIALSAQADTVISRSTDNGLTWSSITTSSSAVHRDLACDATGVWMLLAGVNWLRSTDGGATWTAVGTGGTNIPYAVATDGRGTWLISGAAANSNTWRSVDNGLSWSLYAPTVNVTVADILYSQGYFILATDGSPSIYTVLAGLDTPLFSAKPSGVLSNAFRFAVGKSNAVFCVPTSVTAAQATLKADPAYSYDTGSQFKLPDLMASTNVNTNLKAWIKAGGTYRFTAQSWGKTGMSNGVSVRSVCIARDGTIIAAVIIDPAGAIMRSVDGGLTFTQIQTTNTSYTNTSNTIATDGNGTWLVGAADQMSRSTDNGLTWSAVTTGVSGVNCVAYSNGVFIVAGANFGVARRSVNGGATWAATTGTSYGYIATDGTGVWLAFSGAQVYRSTDNGLNWSAVNTGLVGAGIAISMHVSGICLVTAQNGNTRRSTDRGVTWAAVSTGMTSGIATDMKINSQGVVLLTSGSSQATRVSLDFGLTWALVPAAGQFDGGSYCLAGGDVGPWFQGGANRSPGLATSSSLVVS